VDGHISTQIPLPLARRATKLFAEQVKLQIQKTHR